METKTEQSTEILRDSIIKIFKCNGLILDAVSKMDYGVAGVFQKQKEFHMKNLTAEFVSLKAIHENQSLNLIPHEFLTEFADLKSQF